MTPSREFFSAGKATFTIEIPQEFQDKHGVKPHYTYRIDHVEANGRWAENWFVKLLVGSDNNHDYKTFGMLNPETGKLRLTRKTTLNYQSMVVRLIQRALANIYEGTPERIGNAGFHVHHEGKCGRCGRKLTTPNSIETGIGPICIDKL